jgi:hypothetical protein
MTKVDMESAPKTNIHDKATTARSLLGFHRNVKSCLIEGIVIDVIELEAPLIFIVVGRCD